MQNSHIIVPELSALLVSLIDFSIDTNCFKYPPLPWQQVSVSRSSGGWKSQLVSVMGRSIINIRSEAVTNEAMRREQLEAGSEGQRPEVIIEKMDPRTE